MRAGFAKLTLCRIVTRVIDLNIRRNRPIGQLVGHSMSTNNIVSTADTTLELSVTSMHLTGDPWPAIIRSTHGNLLPETISYRTTGAGIGMIHCWTSGLFRMIVRW